MVIAEQSLSQVRTNVAFLAVPCSCMAYVIVLRVFNRTTVRVKSFPSHQTSSKRTHRTITSSFRGNQAPNIKSQRNAAVVLFADAEPTAFHQHLWQSTLSNDNRKLSEKLWWKHCIKVFSQICRSYMSVKINRSLRIEIVTCDFDWKRADPDVIWRKYRLFDVFASYFCSTESVFVMKTMLPNYIVPIILQLCPTGFLVLLLADHITLSVAVEEDCMYTVTRCTIEQAKIAADHHLQHALSDGFVFVCLD